MAQTGSTLEEVPVSVVATIADNTVKGTPIEFRDSNNRPKTVVDPPLTRAEASFAMARATRRDRGHRYFPHSR